MNIKNKVKNEIEYVGSWGLAAATMAVFALAGGLLLETVTAPFRMIAAVPANLAVAGVQAATEVVQDGDIEQYTGRVKNIGYSRLAQTKGVLYYADIEASDGTMRRLYDSTRVLKGKIANTVVPAAQDLEDRLAWYQRSPASAETMFIGGSEKGLEVGKDYRISAVGSTLLKAKEL